MTQDQDSIRLRACLHFLLNPALTGAEKKQLAACVSRPEDARATLPPIPLDGQHERWQQWLAPLGRIEVAADFIDSWLNTPSNAGARRHWASYWDACYPPLLRNLARPPWLLLLEGELPDTKAPVLAVVGSRNATQAGLRRAREFAADLAGKGWVIVSGLARGVDAAAHAGAIQAQGCTVAVLGCGIDVVYPPEHGQLRQAILSSGGLIMSEYPPATPPDPRFFPARNRIIAGLSHGVLVVEAAVRSGSLITAHQANELGRAVMAIPGSIDTPQARGCHQMIREGARLVETVADIHEELQGQASLPGIPSKPRRRSRKHGSEVGLASTQVAPVAPQAGDLSDNMRRLLALFKGQPLQFDEISTTCALDVAQLAATLTQLELAGLLESRPGQWWAPA